jgi:hypothetical protein
MRGKTGPCGTPCRAGATLTVLILFALVVAGCAATTTTATTTTRPTSVEVRVASCPIPASDYTGTPSTPGSSPPTLRLASSLAPPEGAQIYGTAFPGSVSYLIAPTGATCQGTWASADGGEIMAAASPSGQTQGVVMWTRAGGAGPETDLACPYIPAVLAVDRAFRGNASLCGHPSEDVVRQIPTGSPNLYAAAVWVPAHVKDPNLAGSGDGTDPTVALFTAQIVPLVPGNATPTALGQMIACTLPPAQRNVCTASLEFFLSTQSEVGASVGSARVAVMGDSISEFLAGR